MAVVSYKICAKCKINQPAAMFSPNKRASTGLSSWCKKCSVERVKAWCANNRNKIRESDKISYWLNRDRRLEVARRSRLKNPETGRKRSREYGRRHRVKRAAYMKLWTTRNPEKRAASEAKRRALKAGNSVQIEPVSRKEVHRRAGGRCYLCSRSIALSEMHLDHKIPLSRGGPHTYENAGCACKSCNLKKRQKTPAEFAKRPEAA